MDGLGVESALLGAEQGRTGRAVAGVLELENIFALLLVFAGGNPLGPDWWDDECGWGWRPCQAPKDSLHSPHKSSPPNSMGNGRWDGKNHIIHNQPRPLLLPAELLLRVRLQLILGEEAGRESVESGNVWKEGIERKEKKQTILLLLTEEGVPPDALLMAGSKGKGWWIGKAAPIKSAWLYYGFFGVWFTKCSAAGTAALGKSQGQLKSD